MNTMMSLVEAHAQTRWRGLIAHSPPSKSQTPRLVLIDAQFLHYYQSYNS